MMFMMIIMMMMMISSIILTLVHPLNSFIFIDNKISGCVPCHPGRSLAGRDQQVVAESLPGRSQSQGRF